MMGLAPILISVYNRKKHLIRLVKSLQENIESRDSVLYIVSDAAHNESNNQIVEEIRIYISEIVGFKKVEYIFREKNLGSHISTTKAIHNVFEKHDRLIFLEDDNIVSENFLAYMNIGLNFYYQNKSIFSISGYNYPIKIVNPSSAHSYFFKGFSAWGVGIWKEKWNAVNMEIDFVATLLDARKERKKIVNNLGENVYKTIIKMCQRQMVYADALICYYIYKNEMASVFPEISKVRNYGHDGLGEHGGHTNIFIEQDIDQENKDFFFEEVITFNSSIYKSVLSYFRYTLSIKALILLRFFYHRLLKLKNYFKN